ncbi:MAG: SDR family oxidoreductase [Streptosporangiaceae bacterium]
MNTPVSDSASDPPVLLVTGGAAGIGRALVRRLAARPARVVVVDVDADAGEEAASEVGGVFVRADVRDPAASERAVAAAEDAYGRLDLVHLNAGVDAGEPEPTALDPERYRHAVSVNVDGVYFGVRAALPALRRAGGGAIVATASLAGLVAYPMDPVYGMTKHAVVGLVRALAPRLEADRVRIACVCPGFVDTPLLGEHRQGFVDAGFPLLSPDGVAAAVEAALFSTETGGAWVVQPGRETVPYRFGGVPGPRVPGREAVSPPRLW